MERQCKQKEQESSDGKTKESRGKNDNKRIENGSKEILPPSRSCSVCVGGFESTLDRNTDRLTKWDERPSEVQ